MPSKRGRATAGNRARPKIRRSAASSGAALSAPRRMQTDDSATRDRLLNAAEQLMREEGYAAVTTRGIGAKAGVHPQLVHYYFGSMDELFLELWRRFTGDYLSRQAQAFVSPNPVRTVWQHDSDPRDASLLSELMALARHRKILADEIAGTVEKFRLMQASALARAVDEGALKEIFGTPEVLALCLIGLGRILVVESELGITSGHAEARVRIDGWLEKLEIGLHSRRPQRNAGSE
jgi:AcrR family transcriptional regulator